MAGSSKRDDILKKMLQTKPNPRKPSANKLGGRTEKRVTKRANEKSKK
jgi:hypothetical protein